MRKLLLLIVALVLATPAFAGPETSMREFASSQVKKGVRTIGLGGDGATFGNYSLVWKDAGSALADYGVTHFDTDNQLQFFAVGFALPKVFKDVGVFVLAMSEWGNGLALHLKSAGFPKGADFVGTGNDAAVFLKVAKPLGAGFSLGALVGYETSSWVGNRVDGDGFISYTTNYRPSGGFGVSWEGGKLVLAGVRVATTNDQEVVTDPSGRTTTLLGSWEFRGGISAFPFHGTSIDVGFTSLLRYNTAAATQSFKTYPVAGIEQQLFGSALGLRVGWNETSPTAGLTVRVKPFKLDVAYVRDLGIERTNKLFGTHDNALLASFTYDYAPKEEQPNKPD